MFYIRPFIFHSFSNCTIIWSSILYQKLIQFLDSSWFYHRLYQERSASVHIRECHRLHRSFNGERVNSVDITPWKKGVIYRKERSLYNCAITNPPYHEQVSGRDSVYAMSFTFARLCLPNSWRNNPLLLEIFWDHFRSHQEVRQHIKASLRPICDARSSTSFFSENFLFQFRLSGH